jgi:predicted TPR repeat methyltransferase
VAIYDEIAGPHAEDLDTVTRTAFHLLSSYGYHSAAIKLGQARLALAPGDPAQSYLLAALAHEPLSRAPETYIIDHFNRFAETFDSQLVDVLGYRAPEDLYALVAETRRTFPEVLDLGCGTGLAGPLLRALAGTLTGVDLARKMLEKAAQRCVYDHLVEGEILCFLDPQPECFDLIFATDVVIYFGDLARVMSSTAQALKPGGLFAFSLEHTREPGYVLLPSGRFAHHSSYIEESARENFTVVRAVPTIIRLEAGQPVEGLLYVLQRR